MLTHKAENTDNSENWLCHGNVGNYDNSGSNCDFDNLVAHASSWKIEGVCRDNSKSGSCGSSFAAPILYFLAKPFPRNCRIQVSTTLLNIVILFNAVKVGCLLTTAFSRKFEPLASVRKPMRVTRPYGEQRSTFWLQLSYRYIVPIMVIMAFMHCAAAHAGQDEVDVAARHLQYGFISEDGTGGRDRRRVGFSSRPVEKLVAGETYA
ncbi:hypothetical protein COL26b_001750 [Colletotrichum chrysophilum]|uniref:uncharacterized protein n=1 Tax=Colletotrichum chrysophilum TaxID=1836956 RepID=UPI002300AE9B|nr:uncharacterized protein COL26b_001750 [Colletotrichum chrysophilum]KAJ0379934.1 hypothetical protein COL26b_001750 [Colletotrichum chrysophilum]